jgi:hypothetical protein
MFKLGDYVQVADGFGRIVDIDPEDCNAILVECVHEARVGRDPIRLIERGSLFRRCAMRAEAFYLRVRDCGWRYAFG